MNFCEALPYLKEGKKITSQVLPNGKGCVFLIGKGFYRLNTWGHKEHDQISIEYLEANDWTVLED